MHPLLATVWLLCPTTALADCLRPSSIIGPRLVLLANLAVPNLQDIRSFLEAVINACVRFALLL